MQYNLVFFSKIQYMIVFDFAYKIFSRIYSKPGTFWGIVLYYSLHELLKYTPKAHILYIFLITIVLSSDLSQGR